MATMFLVAKKKSIFSDGNRTNWEYMSPVVYFEQKISGGMTQNATVVI